MARESEGSGQTLSQARQATIDALCDHFANDAMGMEDFEKRVEIAHKASTADELKALLSDLPGGNLPAPRGADASSTELTRAGRSFTVATPGQVKEREFVVAVLGGTSRKGRWTPARKNVSVAVMGGAELDFREAVMAPGVTELQVFALWGGVEIIVPPELNVQSHGFALLGGFEHAGNAIGESEPDVPTLRIVGVACMGGVEITVRHPGETSRDARRRRRKEHKEARRGRRRHRGSDREEE